MVRPIEGEIPLSPPEKPVEQWTVALITTAGVHLKKDEVFDVEAGDSSVRYIPWDAPEEDLMISHTHYDRTDADLDINAVFPITRLREFASEGKIAAMSKTHYGLMGYIPKTEKLVKETIPAIIKNLKKEHVDVVILSPG